MATTRAVLSVDLGQSDDFTAMCLVETTDDGVHVAAAKRLPKKTSYVLQTEEIVKSVERLTAAQPAADLIVVLDLGSAGRAVIDMLRKRIKTANIPATARVHITGCSITAGSTTSGHPRSPNFSVSKTLLPDAFRRLAAADQLTFARGLGDLLTECLSLEIKAENSITGALSWSAPGSSHDDLALSCLQGVHALDVVHGRKAAGRIVL
jgi:hypothetical protein